MDDEKNRKKLSQEEKPRRCESRSGPSARTCTPWPWRNRAKLGSSHAKVEELSEGLGWQHSFLAELSPVIFLCRSKSFLGPVASLKRPESN